MPPPRLMTKRDTFIEKDIMMNIVMNIQDWDSTLPMPTILKPRPLWTGKQVRSGWGAGMFWLGSWFALAGMFLIGDQVCSVWEAGVFCVGSRCLVLAE